MPHSCALLGGFAIGARVALLWQHNANAKCERVHACTRSMPSIYIFIHRLRRKIDKQTNNENIEKKKPQHENIYGLSIP